MGDFKGSSIGGTISGGIFSDVGISLFKMGGSETRVVSPSPFECSIASDSDGVLKLQCVVIGKR